MGILSFLFDGKPPPSVSTYGSTTTNVPQWLSDYTQGVVSQANAVAGQPYQPYGGPRIAPTSGDTQSAYDMTRANVGAYKPLLQGGIDATQGVLGSVLPSLQGNIEGAGRTFTGDTVNQYLNPYAENVTNRAKELANRNFTETLLPQVQNLFTRSGQYGSTKMADKVLQGARDTSESLQSAADASLANAYQASGQQFTSDAGRQGQLAQLGANTGIVGGQQLGALGQTLQKLGLTDAAALQGVGAAEEGKQQQNLDLAYGDFQQQRDYPKQQTDWLSNIIRGIPNSAVGSSTTTSGTGPASVMGPSNASSIGSLLSILKGIGELNKDNEGP